MAAETEIDPRFLELAREAEMLTDIGALDDVVEDKLLRTIVQWRNQSPTDYNLTTAGFDISRFDPTSLLLFQNTDVVFRSVLSNSALTFEWIQLRMDKVKLRAKWLSGNPNLIFWVAAGEEDLWHLARSIYIGRAMRQDPLDQMFINRDDPFHPQGLAEALSPDIADALLGLIEERVLPIPASRPLAPLPRFPRHQRTGRPLVSQRSVWLKRIDNQLSDLVRTGLLEQSVSAHVTSLFKGTSWVDLTHRLFMLTQRDDGSSGSVQRTVALYLSFVQALADKLGRPMPIHMFHGVLP